MLNQLTQIDDAMSPEKPTVVLLTGMALTEQNWERTGIEYLMLDFEIVVLDCRTFLGRVIDNEASEDPRFQNTVRIVSPSKLSEALDTYRPMYAIDFIGPCKEMKIIQPLLKKIACKFVIQKFGSLPQFPFFQRMIFHLQNIRSEKANSLAISEANSSQNRKRIVNFPVYVSLTGSLSRYWTDYRNTRYFAKADVSVAAGRRAINDCRKISNNVISVMSADAHRYQTITSREIRADTFGLPELFAVFVDDALIHASDWSSLGIPTPVQGGEYFKDLNRYFTEFEKTYEIPVVIAGHPSCQWNTSYISAFESRQVIFGHTPGLVIKSCLTIVHSSTATSFAVLGHKPIMVLTSDSLDKTSYGLQIRAMAEELGTDPQFIDRSLQRKDWAEFSTLGYENYLQKFIVEEGCREAHPWERFKAYIKGEI